MTIWFLRDPGRLKRERDGIDELLRSAAWLIGTQWSMNDGLFLDAVIRAHGHDYVVRLSFPSLFPDAPIVVRPQNMQGRISTHQYGGADGPLCLEWGPDNWHRDVTAVQMLESTYRLFEIENPLANSQPEVPVVAPSRHQLTVGQELRNELLRWCETKPFREFLATQPINAVGGFKFSLRKTGENWTVLIHEATPIGGGPWRDDQIPNSLPGAEPTQWHVGVWFKTNIDSQFIVRPDTLPNLKALLAEAGGVKYLATDGSSPVEWIHQQLDGVLVVDRSGGAHLRIVLSDEKLLTITLVRADDASEDIRSPVATELRNRKIGIVGLGSAGSKIAISLARMGVRKFLLVDHDVFLPENVRRHVLDWEAVAQHKVNAMRIAIHRVAADATVDVSSLNIVGQESNASVSGALDRLADCDLILDATASDRVFNLLAAVARTANRPMVWLEVFGGGIGGLVARSRPSVDPTPQDMRNAFLQYCTDHPFPALHANPGNYATKMEDGEVVVASDADVSIIAHHAVHFVPDCFIPAERSRFPMSMYLIGLSKGWVFDAPFVNVPISMASFGTAGWSTGDVTDISPDTLTFLQELLQKNSHATAHTP